jgi:hypothetical protein
MNTSVANVILIFLSIILYSINEKFNSQNICKNIKFVFKYQKNMSIKNQKENFLRKTPPLSGKEDLDSYNFSLFFYKKMISM